MEKQYERRARNEDVAKPVDRQAEWLASLWRSRKAIAACTALVTVLGASATMYLANYRSEGFMQFGGAIPLPLDRPLKDDEVSPGIVLSNYKRYAAVFSTTGRLREFLQQNNLGEVAGVDVLQRALSSREGIAKLIEPVFPFTKLDAKELMEQPKDGGNNVIGLRINFEGDSAETAQRMVRLLGRYALDSIEYLVYSDTLRYKHSELTTRISKLENEIFDSNEKLASLQRKQLALKQIVARFPESSSQTARQVVSVTEESARFLSPTTHLMSSEVEVVQETELIIKKRREQQKCLLLREYYDAAQKLLDTSKSGETILRGLEPIKESIFKKKNMKDELVNEVYNVISIDNQKALTLYMEKSRFIAGPSLPERRVIGWTAALSTSFLAGLLLSLLLVFGFQSMRAPKA